MKGCHPASPLSLERQLSAGPPDQTAALPDGEIRGVYPNRRTDAGAQLRQPQGSRSLAEGILAQTTDDNRHRWLMPRQQAHDLGDHVGVAGSGPPQRVAPRPPRATGGEHQDRPRDLLPPIAPAKHDSFHLRLQVIEPTTPLLSRSPSDLCAKRPFGCVIDVDRLARCGMETTHRRKPITRPSGRSCQTFFYRGTLAPSKDPTISSRTSTESRRCIHSTAHVF